MWRLLLQIRFPHPETAFWTKQRVNQLLRVQLNPVTPRKVRMLIQSYATTSSSYHHHLELHG